MAIEQELYDLVSGSFGMIASIVSVILLIAVFTFVVRIFKIRLLRKAKTKRQISNIKVLARLLDAAFIILVIVTAFFSYIGSLTSASVFLGLITAALGLALQRPITGIVAWIMIVIKRPFNVGDRISIGDIKGDVYDISLSHIYIDEAGGITDGEEHSGRNVMVPNYLLFENSIINYTLLDDYIVGEAIATIKYGSNLNKAIDIIKNVTEKYSKEYTKNAKREIKIKVTLEDMGIKISSRFFAPVKMMQQVSTDINREIYNSLEGQKNIKFANNATR